MPVLSNKKHEAVALAYLSDPHKIGWKAYQQVYPNSGESACRTAWTRLLKNADFANRIAETHEAAAQGKIMDANEVLEELSKLGRANAGDYFRASRDGDPIIDLSKLTREQTAALVSVTVEDFTDGRGEDAREVKRVQFKLGDKKGALDLLGKHHALFTERHLHEFTGIADRLANAIARTEGSKAPKTNGEKRPHHNPPRGRRAGKAARKGKGARAR